MTILWLIYYFDSRRELNILFSLVLLFLPIPTYIFCTMDHLNQFRLSIHYNHNISRKPKIVIFQFFCFFYGRDSQQSIPQAGRRTPDPARGAGRSIGYSEVRPVSCFSAGSVYHTLAISSYAPHYSADMRYNRDGDCHDTGYPNGTRAGLRDYRPAGRRLVFRQPVLFVFPGRTQGRTWRPQ